MRIGKIEASTPTFIYAGIFLALAFFVPSLLLSRLGAIRESWRRDAIIGALTEGGESVAPGITACRDMIAADPSRVAPRMYLGCLLAGDKRFTEASEAFAQAADSKSATDEEKSLALTGAACALSLDGAVDGKPRHLAEAEKKLADAISIKETPDALAAMALLKSWKSGPGGSDVQALVKRAFAAEPAPSLGLLEELYKLNGVIKAASHQPIEASNSYGSVKALNPADKSMDEAARLTLLAGLNEPGMSATARREAIAKVTREVDKFGNSRNEAMLAIGMAWHALKGEPGYLDADGPFEKAIDLFRKVIAANPKDARGYKNYAGLLEERIAAMTAGLSAPVTGFSGETQLLNAWGPATATAGAGGNGIPPLSAALTSAEQDNLQKAGAMLIDVQRQWETMLAKCELDANDKIKAQLRLIACARRRVYLAPWIRPYRRDEMMNVIPEIVEVELLKQAAKVASEMALADESGRGHYVYALVLIESGDLPAALAALQESSKRGFKSNEQAKLLAALDVKTEIADAGPSTGERQFGAVPLIRAAFATPLGMGALKGLKVSVNGKEVGASSFGSEILYVPSADELAGGAHTVRFSAKDVGGTAMRFPEFTYLVDKDPPTWELDPASATVKVDTVFSVSVKDASGVDWASLSAGINSTKAGLLNALLVKDGHYTHALAAAKVKGGDAVLRSPFLVTGPNGLAAGDYKLWIEVRDLAGNKLKDEKSFTVK